MIQTSFESSNTLNNFKQKLPTLKITTKNNLLNNGLILSHHNTTIQSPEEDKVNQSNELRSNVPL